MTLAWRESLANPSGGQESDEAPLGVVSILHPTSTWALAKIASS